LAIRFFSLELAFNNNHNHHRHHHHYHHQQQQQQQQQQLGIQAMQLNCNLTVTHHTTFIFTLAEQHTIPTACTKMISPR